jgi:8-oxo-dGTP diphosphatase
MENAIIRVCFYAKFVDIPISAMYDNLYIDDISLEKQPRVYVRKVNVKSLSDEEMIEYYSHLVYVYEKNGMIACRWI